MSRAKEQWWQPFWTWFCRSARRDGATVSVQRRSLSILTSVAVFIVLCVAWYVSVSRIQPNLAKIPIRLALEHPLCAAGIALSFLVMGFRSTVLDYLAFRIYDKEYVVVSRGLFGNESELRHRYEATFGKDSFYHAPEFVGGISVLIFAISGFVLVFSLG